MSLLLRIIGAEVTPSPSPLLGGYRRQLDYFRRIQKDDEEVMKLVMEAFRKIAA